MTARSVPAAFRSLTREERDELLTLRPDLRAYADDIPAMARASQSADSVARVLRRLSAPERRVIIGLAAGFSATDPALDAGSEIVPILARLSRLGLVVAGPLRATRGVRDHLGPYPAGLAPVRDDEPAKIGERIAGLAESSRALLEKMAWGPPIGTVFTAAGRNSAARLISAGLARIISIAAGCIYAVRRAGRRFSVPLRRVVSVRLGPPVLVRH